MQRLGVDEGEQVRLLNLCALLSTAPLQVPFAQASELAWKLKRLKQRVEAFAAAGKLLLINQSRSFDEFTESRRELYGELGTRAPYEMYFHRKPIFGNRYSAAPELSTTGRIKAQFLAAVESQQFTSNIISNDERDRLIKNADYIRRTLYESKVAATFSVFRHQEIAPKPGEQIFFGRLATRLFIDHYSFARDLIVPTGFLNDPLVETYDLFPLFDLPVNRVLLSELGLGQLIKEDQIPQIILNLIFSEGFERFCELRLKLLQSICSSLTIARDQRPPTSERVSAEVRSLGLGKVRTDQPVDGYVLIHQLEQGIRRRASTDTNFAACWERLSDRVQTINTVALFTVTRVEEDALKAFLAVNGYRLTGVRSLSGVTFSEYKKGNIVVCHIISSMGSGHVGASAQVSQKILPQIKPDLTISVGICFGIDEKNQRESDVLVSEWVLPYEIGKITDEGFQHRGKSLQCCDKVVSLARHLSGRNGLAPIHVGTVFSGELLINSSQKRDDLLRIDSKAIGGDMEAFGIAATCVSERLRFSMIKGISDFAHKKGDDHQRAAAQNAIKVAIEIVERMFTN